MAISPKTAKIIHRRLFSAHGVPRIQTPKTQLRSIKRQSAPELPKRKPKLAPLPVKVR